MALEDLYRSITEHRLVQFVYTNQKNETSVRVCEGYSILDGYFFGYDVVKDGTRQFFLAMISDVTLLDTTFIPRF
jgi:predicted DNA-binding transcriptional regulator YafY